MSNAGVLGAAFAVVVALAGVTGLGGSWYTVDAGYRGVITRNGAVTGTAEPGLGFKMPLIDGVTDISVQSQAVLYESVSSYSRDQQPATLTLSVNYRLPADQVATIYADFGGEEGVKARLLDRQVYDQVKNIFGKYNASSAIQDRAKLVSDIETALRESVKGPIIIESVQIEDIAFDDSYERAVQARMEAEVEVQKLRQNAEREKVQAEIVVTQAKANADAQVAAAEAEAKAIRMRGDAEAAAIQARGKALRDNPQVVALTTAEQWDGKLPITMVPSATVPFIEVK